ncbi:MAG: hypothetical protein RSG57_03235, partial [Christensenellaceae bacterium]
ADLNLIEESPILNTNIAQGTQNVNSDENSKTATLQGENQSDIQKTIDKSAVFVTPTSADAPPRKNPPIPTERDTPSAVMEYVPKVTDADAPPQHTMQAKKAENVVLRNKADKILNAKIKIAKKQILDIFSDTNMNKDKVGDFVDNAVQSILLDRLSKKEYNDAVNELYKGLKAQLDNDSENHNKIKKMMRESRILVTQAVKNEIGDYDVFRKSLFGRLQLVSSNGTPIDTVYAELHDLMPGYFPNEIENAAQQLAYMGEIARKSNLVETDIKKVYGEDYEVYTKNRIDTIISNIREDIKDAKDYSRIYKKELPEVITLEMLKQAYKEKAVAKDSAESIDKVALFSENDRIIIDGLRKGKSIDDEKNIPANVQEIVDYAESMKKADANQRIIEKFNKDARRELSDLMKLLTENSGLWKDRKIPLATYMTNTQEQNILDIAKRDAKNAQRIVEQIFAPIHKNEAEAQRFLAEMLGIVKKLQLNEFEGALVQAWNENKITEVQLRDAIEQKRLVVKNEKGDVIYDKAFKGKKGVIDVENIKPVARLKGTEFAKSDVSLRDQVNEFFDGLGNVVTNDVLGEVELNNRGIKDSMAHGLSRQKAIAFAAVPDVI